MEEIILTVPYRLLAENVTHGREGFTEEDLTNIAASWYVCKLKMKLDYRHSLIRRCY